MWAWAAATPWVVSPWYMALGNVLVSPTIMSEKKTPIESTMPVFMKAA